MTPTLYAGIVVLAGFLTSSSGAIYWQLALCLLGGTIAIGLPALGGATILPAVLFLPFLAIRAWREQRGRNYLRHVPEAALWLALAVAYGVLTAIVMPRIFAGQVQVVSVDRSAGLQLPLSPLRPVSGNITQSGYAVGGVLTFIAMRALLVSPARLVHFRNAVLLLAALDVTAGLLNLAEFYLGFPKVLAYVRTAYAVFGDYEVAGLVRIHGTFSETSAFCGLSLPLFAFCFSLWLQKVSPTRSGPLALLLLVFLLISTSTTAYVGLAIYGLFVVLGLAYRAYSRRLLPRAEWLLAGTLAFLLFLGANFLFETSFADKLSEYLDVTAFSKMNSTSGAERSMWNHQAWSNFIDTYGLGVGLGTIRCSSIALVLPSNLGVIGTVLYTLFLKKTLSGPAAGAQVDPTTVAARHAAIAALSAALIVLPTFDMGIPFYCYAAAASLGPELSRLRPALADASRAEYA